MKQIFSLLGLILVSKIGLACSCMPYEPDFFKNISKQTYNCIAVFDTMDYSYEYEGLQAQTAYFILIDTIGNFGSEIGDTIIVTGQDGLNCGEMLNGFTRGDTMFLALYNGFYETFTSDTFYLEGACGKFFLAINNGQNNGLNSQEIKAKIQESFTGFGTNYLSNKIEVTPNPVNCILTIKTFDFMLSEIIVTDMLGRTILSLSNLNTTTIEIDMTNYECGLYNIVLNKRSSKINRRIIKY